MDPKLRKELESAISRCTVVALSEALSKMEEADSESEIKNLAEGLSGEFIAKSSAALHDMPHSVVCDFAARVYCSDPRFRQMITEVIMVADISRKMTGKSFKQVFESVIEKADAEGWNLPGE